MLQHLVKRPEGGSRPSVLAKRNSSASSDEYITSPDNTYWRLLLPAAGRHGVPRPFGGSPGCPGPGLPTARSFPKRALERRFSTKHAVDQLKRFCDDRTSVGRAQKSVYDLHLVRAAVPRVTKNPPARSSVPRRSSNSRRRAPGFDRAGAAAPMHLRSKTGPCPASRARRRLP